MQRLEKLCDNRSGQKMSLNKLSWQNMVHTVGAQCFTARKVALIDLLVG